jgi:LCP family protein required for cell wall assembly
MQPATRGVVRRAFVVLAIAAVVGVGYTAVRLWNAWNNVDRVGFETDDARIVLATPPDSMATIPPEDDDSSGVPLVEGDVIEDLEDVFTTAGRRIGSDTLQVFLIVGSDQRAETGTSQRADVIMLMMFPATGGDPILTSIPRDLYLPNPCSGGLSRINANLNGCGQSVTGPEQLAVAIEDFTGVPIDHYALFDFEGFKDIVDRVGGVEVCVDYPVRDLNVTPLALQLPAGCSTLGGDMALSWVRSRKTEVLLNSGWERMSGVSDLTRNERQQDLILQALSRLKSFTDVSELTALVEELSGAFTIDNGLSLSGAVSLAWDLRSVDLGAIVRPTIPVANYVAPDGAYVLVPTDSFENVILNADPEAASIFASG